MTDTPRKPRKKATTEHGRQLLARARDRLAKQEAALAEQLLREAELADKAAQRAVVTLDRGGNRQAAVQRSVVRRVAAVLSSERVNVPIHANPASRASAWTDFRKIVVNYEEHDDPRVTLATLRGFLYHEGGHVRFSVPFKTLRRLVGKPALPEGVTMARLQGAWNVLEDQRMETAVVSASPRKAAYFTPMVLTFLCDSPIRAGANYPLLVWRRYLPKHIRRGARAMFVTAHGEDFTREVERLVARYVRATTPEAMYEVVVAFASLGVEADTTVDEHRDPVTDHFTPEDAGDEDAMERIVIPILQSMLDEDDEDEDEEDEDPFAGEDAEGGGGFDLDGLRKAIEEVIPEDFLNTPSGASSDAGGEDDDDDDEDYDPDDDRGADIPDETWNGDGDDESGGNGATDHGSHDDLTADDGLGGSGKGTRWVDGSGGTACPSGHQHEPAPDSSPSADVVIPDPGMVTP